MPLNKAINGLKPCFAALLLAGAAACSGPDSSGLPELPTVSMDGFPPAVRA